VNCWHDIICIPKDRKCSGKYSSKTNVSFSKYTDSVRVVLYSVKIVRTYLLLVIVIMENESLLVYSIVFIVTWNPLEKNLMVLVHNTMSNILWLLNRWWESFRREFWNYIILKATNTKEKEFWKVFLRIQEKLLYCKICRKT